MKNLKVIIIVLGLGGAGLMFFMNMKKEEPIPDTPESKSLWMCNACQKTVEWTTKQEYENSGSAAPPLFCPSCKARELYRAQKCEQCGTVFFGADVPGSSGVCPKCHPDVKPAPPPEEEEKKQGEETATDEVTAPKRTMKAI